MPDAEWPRAIIHADLDAFYASVEQLRRPELRGRPVIVGGGADADGNAVMGRGVVSAASYEARKFGVRSAMPLGQALRLCPQATVVPVDFVAYRAASEKVFAIFRSITPLVEPLSLDEAYLDVTGSIRIFGSPESIAERLRDEVLQATDLNLSVGVATCKCVAKVASDLRKPRGLVIVSPGDEAEFFAPLSLRTLPGLGPSAEKSLSSLGVRTLGQLASLPQDVVVRRMGKHAGFSLWERAQGIDESPVTVPDQPKSVSREETFGRDISNTSILHQRLRDLAADVGARLRSQKLAGRTITLKLRYTDFTTLARQQSVADATNTDHVIATAAISLFDNEWAKTPVRLLGVGVSNLEDEQQLDLFGANAKDARLDHVLDNLRSRFGPQAARRGAGATLRDTDFRGDDLRRIGKDDSQ